MDPELKRLLEIEAQEKFLVTMRELGKEHDRKMAEDQAKAVAEQDATIKSQQHREMMERAKERRIQESKDRIPLTPELSEYICRRIASGEMLKAICEEQTMPSFLLAQEWFDDQQYDWFHKAYMRACTLRDRAFEDEIVMISDNSNNDYIDKVNSRTGESFRQIDPEVLTRSKMRIDVRLRILRANNPARWGDNPNAGEATKELLKNIRPIVNISFIEAPKSFVQGDDAKVIEHQAADRSLAAPPVALDKHDLEFIRKREEKQKTNKVA